MRGLVPIHNVRRNPAAVADLKTAAFRPRSNLRAALPMCRSAAAATRPPGCLARVGQVPSDNLIKLVTVLLAQVNLVVLPVEAEDPRPLLTARDLFLVIVTCVGNRYLLRH